MKYIYSIGMMVILLFNQGCSSIQWSEMNRKAYGEQEEAVPLPRNDEIDLPMEQEEKQAAESAEQQPVHMEPASSVQKVTLAAIGDILIHSTVYNQAKRGSGYDFSPMFTNVKPYIAQADLAIANQETMIGGVEFGLSSYPTFNSPQEVGDALKDVGIDLVTLANNHTLDRGEKVIQSALTYWDFLGIPYTGAYKSADDAESIRLIEKNGIKIAFLAYTYGTNGIPIPKNKPYLVNVIDPNKIKKDLALANEQSDVQVISLHFGQEYQRYPNHDQKKLVQELSNVGADVIIGHHPHVLQPPAWIDGKDGNRTFVVYSLGNFLSGQKGDWKDIGGIIQVEIEKLMIDGNTVIRVQNPAFVPTWVTKDPQTKKPIIYLLGEVKEKKVLYEQVRRHMSQWIPEIKFYFFEY